MKRSLYILAVVLSSSLILTSCFSTKTVSVDEAYIAKYGFIMAKPQIVEINVEIRKISGKAVIKNKLYGNEYVVETAMKLAVIDAIKRGNADIIVQPTFEIESDRTYTNATVTGYAGRYTRFREITSADTTAFWIRRILDSYASNAVAPAAKTVIKK